MWKAEKNISGLFEGNFIRLQIQKSLLFWRLSGKGAVAQSVQLNKDKPMEGGICS